MPAAMDGATPTDLTEYSTLPLIELSTGEGVIAAGEQAQFSLRLLDPASQEPLDGISDAVRFDPNANVTLTLSHADEADIIVIPLKVDETTWEAALPLDTFGSWSATVSVSYGDGSRWSSSWPAIVDVAPSFLGDDGKRYAYRLTLDPAEPYVDEPVLVRVALQSIEDGAPLPPGVEIEGGLPERVQVTLMADGFKSVTLQPIVHGVWEDETTFIWAGRMQAELSVNQPEVEGLPLRVNAGSVEVLPGARR